MGGRISLDLIELRDYSREFARRMAAGPKTRKSKKATGTIATEQLI